MNEDKKTLVILTPAFPENESANYWVPSQQLLVKAMKRNFPEWDFEVIAFLYPYQRSQYKWNDIPVTSYHGTRYGGIKRLLLWRKIWKQLKRLHSKKKLAGILSFWCMECALVGSWFARRNRLRHFCWICGQDARASNRYIRLIRPKPGELVAISDFVSAEFYRNYKIHPHRVVPNAIDETLFQTGMPDTRDIDILGVGGLIPLKQFHILVEITKQLQQSIPDIKVIICGEGEEKKALETLIKRLDLGRNIQLTGSLRHEEVLKLLHSAKLLLHPSSYEGFSTVCLEAIYAGTPVISFAKPMNHDIKNWYIAASPKEMEAKAREILTAPALSRERVMVWSMDEIAKEMVHLFE